MHLGGRFLAASAALLAVVALLSACSQPSGRGITEHYAYRGSQAHGAVIPPERRPPAGLLRGTLIGGTGTYELRAERGKVVVLSFMASWCGPCQTEVLAFQKMHESNDHPEVRFVGLDVKDPSQSASLAWLAGKKITFPVVFDVPARTAQQLGALPVAALPQTVLVDRRGRVAAVYGGPTATADLVRALQTLSAEPGP